MHSMAHVKDDLGDFVSAHLFHTKTVKIREAVFGDDHKHTHISRNSMKNFMESNLNVKSTAPETVLDKLKKTKVGKYFSDHILNKKT